MLDIYLAYDSSDEYWRIRFDDVFGQEFHCKMISPGDIDTSDGNTFIQWLHQKDFINSDTVVIVLMGPKAFSSKKLDWEIAAALEKKGARPGGVVPIRLPNHQDHRQKSVNPKRIPVRVADNLKSGYLKLYDWTESRGELEKWIYAAHKDARNRGHLVKNSRTLMERDMFL